MLKFCDFTLAVVWLHPEPFYQGREWDARCLHLKYNLSFHLLDFHGWPTVLLMNGDIDWALLCMGLWCPGRLSLCLPSTSQPTEVGEVMLSLSIRDTGVSQCERGSDSASDSTLRLRKEPLYRQAL